MILRIQQNMLDSTKTAPSSPAPGAYYSCMGEELDEAYAPTELSSAIEGTEAITAWSLDDGEEWGSPRGLTPGRITALAVAGSLTALVVAGGLAAYHLSEEPDPTAPAPSTSQTAAPQMSPIRLPPPPPTSAPPPPPPVTVTSTVAAPAPTTSPRDGGFTPEDIAPYDRQFVANLRALNWVIVNEQVLARDAHRVCWRLEQGATPWAVQQEMVDAGRPLSDAQMFVVTAMQTYPSCP